MLCQFVLESFISQNTRLSLLISSLPELLGMLGCYCKYMVSSLVRVLRKSISFVTTVMAFIRKHITLTRKEKWVIIEIVMCNMLFYMGVRVLEFRVFQVSQT